ncbi:aromatic-ring hydroxylase C-terminal domain-containing protein [Thermocatellispora tengchongensis]|uniref:aromatic-ring hydroxylase C-terminal domain-containing protein n=1 Tax=Thermocatellispora tengchongensis TaxID=1073253 RepID=UPI003633717F
MPDGRSLYDALGEGFTLLRLAAGADPAPLLDAAARLSVPMRLLDLSGVAHLRGRYGEDLVLVRPDQHIAWRGGHPAAPDALLARVLGGAPRPAAGVRATGRELAGGG